MERWGKEHLLFIIVAYKEVGRKQQTHLIMNTSLSLPKDIIKNSY